MENTQGKSIGQMFDTTVRINSDFYANKIKPTTYQTFSEHVGERIVYANKMQDTDERLLKNVFDGGFLFVFGCTKQYEPVLILKDWNANEESFKMVIKTGNAFYHFLKTLSPDEHYTMSEGVLEGIQLGFAKFNQELEQEHREKTK